MCSWGWKAEASWAQRSLLRERKASIRDWKLQGSELDTSSWRSSPAESGSSCTQEHHLIFLFQDYLLSPSFSPAPHDPALMSSLHMTYYVIFLLFAYLLLGEELWRKGMSSGPVYSRCSINTFSVNALWWLLIVPVTASVAIRLPYKVSSAKTRNVCREAGKGRGAGKTMGCKLHPAFFFLFFLFLESPWEL